MLLCYIIYPKKEMDFPLIFFIKILLHSIFTECTYCGHCKPCVSDLDIAIINKFYDLATMQPKVPATVQSHYELLEHKVSECIGCQACESRCPFGVPLAERMKKTAELFGC